MFCCRCGKEIENGSRFCVFCGEEQISIQSGSAERSVIYKKPEVMKCPYCKAIIEDDSVFCPVCGKHLDGGKANRRKAPIIGIGVCILLVVICVSCVLFLKQKEEKEQWEFSSKKAEVYDVPEVKKQEDETKQDVKNENNTDIDKERGEEEQDKESEKMKEKPDDKKLENNMEQETEYILEMSNSKYLTDTDVSSLSIKEINYAKNEIYARHGRRFQSKELQDYFDTKTWYIGKYSPEEFDNKYSINVLSDVEKKNAEFLRNKEFAMNPAGYQLDSY